MSGKKIIQSETVTIQRSKIKFAPYNPKHHTDDAVKEQKKNLLRVGYLGGIVWNATTGNLISGHKRVMAFDLIYKYDGTKDYKIKVEKIEMSEKQEKEQNIYMDAKNTNTSQDLNLISEMLPEIDWKLAGLTDQDMNLMVVNSPNFDFGDNTEAKTDYKELSKKSAENKERIKQVKKDIKQGLAIKVGAPYVTLSFESYENKIMFMEAYGYNSDNLFIRGEEFFDKIQK